MSQPQPPAYFSTNPTTTSLSKWTELEKNPKFVLITTLSILLLIAITATVASLSAHWNSLATTHAILHSSCSTTRFPDLCHSAIASSPSLLRTISSSKDVILASLNLTESGVAHSIAHVHNLAALRNNTARERTALDDCLHMFSESLDELRRTAADLRSLPEGKEPPPEAAAELEILVSAAMTNQDSCLDGFSHDAVSRHLRENIVGELEHVTKMCSNALAMIKRLVNGGGGKGVQRRKMIGFGVDGEGLPEWMGEGDRRMAEEEVVADVVVAADGSGDYSTISEAVAAAPVKSKKRYVIRIKEGTYEENVEVPKKKTNIMFVGDGRKTTVITGSRNVVDGSTTFKSATLGQVTGCVTDGSRS